MSTHPAAAVPETLFDDEREQRWRARFTAVRMSRPHWALDAPDRCVYTSNASGTTQIHLWDRASDEHRQLTDRPAGTFLATLSPDGEDVWWFADTDGDEFGHWVTQPFTGGPVGTPLPAVEDGYSAGLDIGREHVVVGTSTDEGTTIWLDERVLYRHPEDAGVGGLSEDETLVAISHSEHGDSRHPALRVLTRDGETVAEKWDGPGKGLGAIAFSPVRGDQRLLVGHERRGREELLLWDVATDTETELDLDLPGELEADFYPDASALLVWHTHAARTRLHRYDLTTGELAELPTAPGCIGSADVRPDGVLEYTVTSAAHPSSVRALGPDGDRVLVSLGEPAPDSVPVRDLWVGDVHALVAAPAQTGPLPTIFTLHGGPHAADEDRFSPVRAAWVDAGFAVVEVNYRGSTGYGSAWRDAIEGRPGLTELEDVAAVHSAVVASGLADPARCVVEGWSWGGYLALLAAGTQPDRWAAAIGGVPVADYVAAYEDEMEQLRAFDRALFGGSPEEVPETYRVASPLTYVDRVRAPVLILAGENDPRCPIRQVDTYLDALADRADLPYEVARFDAGHGSLVVAETLRHMATEIDFVRRSLARITVPST
ncbi:prolyl oligopeptidase family serine peptidase [Pseudonocardia sp. WMMC193]|uniref:S9 family peptidase n=1 Tax=Pseudonocardia sp. WMMC193 TaxID=2911965 RepID=UPI001F012E76|nr:prolyl oligopeptidase family serine peptidase [Pseudonocardia sp. WMMC193]MCF7551641.1 prolyl oligopeptidase family serine peptidase [Pseudonocardia sp. WMMC193]